MQRENEMEVRFPAVSENESFARVCAGAFASQLDPTVEQISDIKTAVSEAVTNVIVHAYKDRAGEVVLRMQLSGGEVTVEVEDFGCGIENIEEALEPFYSSGGEERSGMGFTLMSTFMDSLEVTSRMGGGTRVFMRKTISA